MQFSYVFIKKNLVYKYFSCNSHKCFSCNSIKFFKKEMHDYKVSTFGYNGIFLISVFK